MEAVTVSIPINRVSETYDARPSALPILLEVEQELETGTKLPAGRYTYPVFIATTAIVPHKNS